MNIRPMDNKNQARVSSGKDAADNSVLQELKENPYRRFNIAFSLMAIIPFLGLFYLLINSSSIDILAGPAGIILFICLAISVCGFVIGYFLIDKISKRLLFYAVRLKKSDSEKSAMVASVSHELKSPLSIIQTSLGIISDESMGRLGAEQRKIVELCLRVVERMSRLVSDLLDLHKIEAGMADMKRELCDLSKLLESQVAEFTPLISKKGIKIVTELLDTDLDIWADGDRITQVINNLLSNAIKNTPDGQPLTLRAYPLERFIRLEVADRGPGIPPEKLEKVFDKFGKLDASKEGTGLGLAITKDIVESHKGRIWAESLPGNGSTFVVVLPRDLRHSARTRKE